MKEKVKELEVKLRKILELNEQSQTNKDILKSNIGNVIRRRKGEPDKWIPYKLNR